MPSMSVRIGRLLARAHRGLTLAAGAALAGWGLVGAHGACDPASDLVNHGAPAAALASALALALALLAPRGPARGPSIAFAAAALALQTAVMAPAIVPNGLLNALSPPPPGAELTVMSFNMRGGYGFDPARTEAALRAEDADVIALSEVGGPNLALLARLKDRWPHQVHCLEQAGCDVAILSRRPIVARETAGMATPHPDGGLWATALLRARVDMGAAGTMDVFAVHLGHPWPIARQEIQRRQVARRLAAQGAQPSVLAGDMNSTPWSFALRRLEREGGLRRATRAVFSFPVATGEGWRRGPLVPIDHVFVNGGLVPLSARRGPSASSDHYPVVARLRLRPAGG